jgi:hypothetical protein
MEFTEEQLMAIQRACLVQANSDRKLAEMTDRPAIRNQRLESARELLEVSSEIEEGRRQRALLAKHCDACDEQ